MIELTKVSELATENVAATVVASTVAAGGLFLVTYNLMGPKIRSDKGTSKRNFFTLSKGLGGLKRKESPENGRTTTRPSPRYAHPVRSKDPSGNGTSENRVVASPARVC